MIPVKLKVIERAAPYRPDGYVDSCKHAAERESGGVLYFKDDIYAELKRRFPPKGGPPTPILAGYDPSIEAARMRQGGCCGAPTE